MDPIPNILIVDDDRDLLKMVSLMLTKHNMQVHCAHKGADLFDSISACHPNIILMDIYLGDADGRELCHNLKTVERYSHIPVILYSAGFITHESIRHSLAAEFISKPFEMNDLVNKINSLVAAA